ncbi:uncharacterized protein PHACADRAFT_256634 [Phanerochaete carnosa HHB-10118-sp]|uniref:PHD-type domain-containing protein n=1 Tax=Phanerochaete carnosa (strain HHB-10118-sp) TaxID=650164 RepID=K5WZ41_PHACS|nr:uncharacterized protein PHACADRAFT_256634 [Phanerochaete carnosa HHB-10118-sp]EKM55772.1 hypothetical protein PHACADRAFT_256634 [Phanerochaete carnosa HHB-10118-sp]
MTSVEGIPACLLAAPTVTQPLHLEGDPALATEILPGPPPLPSVQQLGQLKKDHKKTSVVTSYLPTSDPGTTYGANTVSTMAITTEVDGSRRKRARLDKGSSSSRAQRASARSMAVTASTSAAASETSVPADAVASSATLIPESDLMQVDSDDAMLSRSNSVQLGDEEVSSARRGSLRRDIKGKGRERAAQVRVKEEPETISLSAYDAQAPSQTSNEDHCSACRSLGSLVYCDGCPRAYHFWCLNPPMDVTDLPAGDAKWLCPACMLKQKPPTKPTASLKFMAPLIDQLQTSLPGEFQLPQDIRSFFKDVSTGPKGTYVDSSEVKVPRLNRHGQLEDREPYRLKDRNGDPVLCYRCGASALPPDLAAAGPATKRARRAASACSTAQDAAGGRSIISCDYCHLHWHLDCLDPPMTYMPLWNKRWMCPNHADQILQPKKRIPKNNAPPIEVMKPGQFNNGNIEVTQPETPNAPPPKLIVDEVLINGRRYRVPERVITMDFWSKTGKGRPHLQDECPPHSALSSPLTSLSSVGPMDDDDIEDIALKVDPQDNKMQFDLDQLKAALALCGLQQIPAKGGSSQPLLPAPAGNSTKAEHTKNKASKPTAARTSGTITEIAGDSAASGNLQPELRRSGRASTTRRLRPWNHTETSVDGTDDLSEDSREYLPAQIEAARRPKRDYNGKFTRKAERKGAKSSKAATSTTPSSAQPGPPSVAPEPPAQSETAPESGSAANGISRPKRNRQPPRRLDSPMITTPALPPPPPAPAVTPPAAKITPPPPTKQTTPMNEPSPHINGVVHSQRLALSVPAPTSLHPSLRSYKSTPPTPVEPPKKEKSASVAPVAKPMTPKAALPSVTKETTTPSSGLKIRLPRMTAIMSPTVKTEPPAEPGESVSSRSKTQLQSSSGSRPRRSLRRGTSVATSITGTSPSTPPSPKAVLSSVA